MTATPSASDFLKAATHTARHFGFEDLDTVKASVARKTSEEHFIHRATSIDKRTDALHGMLTSGVCTYIDNRLYRTNEPVLYYSTNTVPRTGETALSLHVLGVPKSIAEALLIQTTRALFEDLGYGDHTVKINSLGDQDSIARYIRELTHYLKKRMDDLPPPARELMKEHVFSTLMYLIDKDHELAHRSPNPLEYLSDSSRRHFREIIEFLDMSQTPYEIEPKLIGNHQCYSEALFTIEAQNPEVPEEQPILVRGGRYDTFISRVSDDSLAAAGAVVVLRGKKAPTRIPQPRKDTQPLLFVVQLGFGPKIRSLMLVNDLKRAGIAVLQDVVSDSLGAQLQKAEDRGIQYALIIGQKEYVDKTVIVRNLHARSQEFVSMDSILSHLKKITRV